MLQLEYFSLKKIMKTTYYLRSKKGLYYTIFPFMSTSNKSEKHQMLQFKLSSYLKVNIFFKSEFST